MSAEFDGYHEWLSIPPSEQPPNYYRLLGVELFEDDLDVIDSAAELQLSYLEQFKEGPHGRLARKMISKTSEARDCLSDLDDKTAYDINLGRDPKSAKSNRSKSRPVKQADAPATEPAAAESFDFTSAMDTQRDRTKSRSVPIQSRPGKKQNPLVLPIVIVICAVVLVGALVTVLIRSGSSDKTEQNNAVAQTEDEGGDNVAGDSEDLNIPEPGKWTGTSANAGRPAARNKAVRPTGNAQSASRLQPRPTAAPQDLLIKAQGELAQRNIPNAITHLRQYVNGDPDPSHEADARELLRQCEIADSNESVHQFIDGFLEKLTDDDILKIGQTGKWGNHVIDPATFPVNHPVLQEAFFKKIQQNIGAGIVRRFHKIQGRQDN